MVLIQKPIKLFLHFRKLQGIGYLVKCAGQILCHWCALYTLLQFSNLVNTHTHTSSQNDTASKMVSTSAFSSVYVLCMIIPPTQATPQ